jgi:uncharacterized protein
MNEHRSDLEPGDGGAGSTATATDSMSDGEFLAAIRAFEGASLGAGQPGPDAVNEAMIRHWCAAMGDTNPIYVDDDAAREAGFDGIVAPPTMLQAWVMATGPGATLRTADSPQTKLMGLLESRGFTSVVAVNCEQSYERYLRPGDRLTMHPTIDSVSEEKTTALGVGHFVTTRNAYHDASGALVGSMLFRILKFRPNPKRDAAPARPPRPRPSITHDNAFFFEGAREGKFLVQKCSSCGQVRHPPGPMCSACRSLEWEPIEPSGRGVIYSFVVMHHPPVPAFDQPNPVVLVELEEGLRIVSNLIDATPDDVRIGLPVQVEVVKFDDELSLPQFRIVATEGS